MAVHGVPRVLEAHEGNLGFAGGSARGRGWEGGPSMITNPPPPERDKDNQGWTVVKGRRKVRGRQNTGPVRREGTGEGRFPRVHGSVTSKEKGVGMGTRALSVPTVKLVFRVGSPMAWNKICNEGLIMEAHRKLSFVQPTEEEGQLVAVVDEEEIRETKRRWANTLVVYVLGRKPFFQYFKAFAARSWRPSSSMEIFSKENGFFSANSSWLRM